MTTLPPTEWDPEGFAGHFDGGPEETRRGLDRVPASLSDRLDLTEVLGDVRSTAQAVVLRVKDREARHRDAAVPLVLKWYHRAFAPDPEASRVLSGDLGDHVVRILEHGIADGHPYELLPSYGETTLAQYHARNPGALPAPLVRTTVAHLHRALTALHDQELVHRDVTPDNIVVSTQNADRLDLVLVDCGAAVHTGRDEDSPPPGLAGKAPLPRPRGEHPPAERHPRRRLVVRRHGRGRTRRMGGTPSTTAATRRSSWRSPPTTPSSRS